MAEKYHVQVVQGYPLAPPTMPRSDQESSTNYQSQVLMKKKKRMRCIVFITILAILLILAIVLVFAPTSTPRVRLHNNVVINSVVNGNIRFTVRASVRNRNFGRYKFDSSVATIMSGETAVGQLVIPDGRVRLRSTRRIYVIGNIYSSGNSSTTMRLTVSARLRGEIEFVRIIDRRRYADLRCTMDLSNGVLIITGCA